MRGAAARRRLTLLVLLHAGLLPSLRAQVDPTELCRQRASDMGPDLLLAAELGAGANAARSERLPWRLTGRVMPTYMVDRARGIGIGAIVGGATSQPAGAVLGARAAIRIASVGSINGSSIPGTDVQAAVEYGYMAGSDQAHALAGTVGLDLVDLARVTLRTNRIFPYDSDDGRVPGQWVFELGVGRTFSLHTPPPPPLRLPKVPSELKEAFSLGQTVALAATLIPAQPATDTTPAAPRRCNERAIAAMFAFSRQDADRVRSRAELLAALKARGLGQEAHTIDLFFPATGPVSEAQQVGAIIAGIRAVFPP